MRLTRAKISLICSLVFILGIALASILPPSIANNDFAWFLGLVASSTGLIIFWEKIAKTRIVLVFFLTLIFLCLAFWRYYFILPKNTPDNIAYYTNQNINISGIIYEEPEQGEKTQKLYLETLKGKILIISELYPKYYYGDELKINCNLKAPEKFEGFDYPRYLGRFKIYTLCYYPKINLIAHDRGNYFFAKILKIKNKIREILSFGLTDPAASLAEAIMLGDKKDLPEKIKNQFSQSGLSHIMAISGMNIGIILALTMTGLINLGLSRQIAFYPSIVFLLIYIILIGLPASAVRADIMGSLLLWGLKLGRLTKIINTLALAAAIMLALNPLLLLADIGFQLSFLAVLGIIIFYPELEKISQKIILKIKNNLFKKIAKIILEIFNITIAAQIFILPIIAINFSQISLIAPLANLAVLWCLPMIITLIFGGIILSLIVPAFSLVFFAPALLFLNYLIFAAEFFAKIPFAYFNLEKINYIFIIFYYFFFIVLALRLKHKQPLSFSRK